MLASPREVVGNILSSGLSGSPLSRAGYEIAQSCPNFAHLTTIFRLLQFGHHLHPTSSAPRFTFVPHSQDDIRSHTMQLSNVAISSSKTSHPSPFPSPSPYEQSLSHGSESQTPRMPPAMSQYHSAPGNLSSSFKSMRLENVGPNLVPQYQTTTPSGLSLLLATRRAELLRPSSREAGLPVSLESSLSLTPQPRNEPVDLSTSSPPTRTSPRSSGPEGPPSQLSEEASLLTYNAVPNISYSSIEAGLSHSPSKSQFRVRLASVSETALARSEDLLATCIRSIPAVLLGVLLNVLDGVSCELSQSSLRSSLTIDAGQMV